MKVNQAPRFPKPADRDFSYALEEEFRRHAQAINANEIRFGTTAGRPDPAAPWSLYVDTTLGKLILFDGSDWVNADGSAL